MNLIPEYTVKGIINRDIISLFVAYLFQPLKLVSVTLLVWLCFMILDYKTMNFFILYFKRGYLLG